MRILRPAILSLTLLILIFALSSCGDDTAYAPENLANKRPAVPHLYVDPDFLVDVENSFDSAHWNSIFVEVNLAGDFVKAYADDWPLSHAFQITVPGDGKPKNLTTIEIIYQIPDPISNRTPKMPGDATLYMFRNLPSNSYGLQLSLPPAPWYDNNQYQSHSSTYWIDRNSYDMPVISGHTMTRGVENEDASGTFLE
jgi:hypothetical protein